MSRKAVPNRTMITHINDVLGISMRSLCLSIDIPVNTFTHWTERGVIRIPELVRICNLYRIPFRCFLCFDGEEPRFRSANNLAVPAERFRPVVFHYERIKKCGRDCMPKMKVADITARMGICFNTFTKFYQEKDAVNFTIDYFLQLCEVTGLPMEYFLDDESYVCEIVKQPVREEEADEDEKNNATQIAPKEQEEMVALLREENELLKKQIKILQKRMDDMEKKLSSVRKQVKPIHDYPSMDAERTNAAEHRSGSYRKPR